MKIIHMNTPKLMDWDPSITFTLSNAAPTLCLNMIVKNESKIIKRLLQSVVDIIDSYCICDTGSTDETIEIITDFFKKAGIAGKIVREPFRDFGYNRTFALNACNGMPNADYLLLLDADMIFQLNPDISPNTFKEMLKLDSYCIFQGSATHFYKNTRIVKNNRGISYWGVTHEYVKLPDGCTQSTFERSVAFINDVGDGGSKANKFARDIELLQNGLREHPNNDRYTFYLANSYHDSGQFDLAIEYYRRRTELGGWHEERWYSYYRIGLCFAKKSDMPNAIHAWMNAYDIFPNRVENLYEIIKYYRMSGKTTLAYAFYVLADNARTLHPSRDYLFTDKDLYEYKLDFELSIIGYYTNPNNYNISHCCIDVVNHPYVDTNSVSNVLSNYKFYATALLAKSTNKIDFSALHNIGKSFAEELAGFYPSTPTMCLDKTGNTLTVLKRYVNYKITENGGYENQEKIVTKNVISTFRLNMGDHKIEPTGEPEFLLDYNTIVDNVYVGLEDVRLFETGNTIYYNCNRGINYHNIRVEHGILDKPNKTTYNSVLLQKQGSSEIEKNWVIIDKKDGDIYCIYKWYPLVIGKIANDPHTTDDIPSIFQTVHEHPTPGCFKHLRGSTNGVRIGDEIWIMAHTVSYEDRRYYYQMFVILDATTYMPKRYTPWFTFEKKKVEYSLGFVYMKDLDSLLIGYSLMDCETKYMTVDRSEIYDTMIPV